MMPAINLALIVPEIILVATLALAMIGEIFFPKKSFKESNIPFIGCLCGIAVATIAVILNYSTVDATFGGMYLFDGFSAFFKCFFALGMLVLFIITRPFITEENLRSEIYLIFICVLIGLFVLVSSNHFILLFLSLEIVTLSSYILAAYAKRQLFSIEAGLKYLVIGSLASAFLIFGISLLYLQTGHLDFTGIRTYFEAQPSQPVLILGFLLILCAIGFKISAVPFQFWVPDVYQGSPIPVTAFLSTLSKGAGFAVLLKTLFLVMPSYDFQRDVLFVAFCILTLLYGNLGALVQTNIKRLMGYSGIAHAGYLMMGVLGGTAAGVSAMLYYLMAYLVSTLTVFYVIQLSSRTLQSDDIDSYQGLGQRSPFLAGVLFLGLLSTAGIPPLAGFFGKFLILLTTIQNGFQWIALLGVIGVVVSLYYYLVIVRTLYFEAPSERSFKFDIAWGHKAVLLVLCVLILVMGIWQAPFMGWAKSAASFLF